MSEMSIDDNTLGIMDDIANDTAFDRGLETQISTLQTDFGSLQTSFNQIPSSFLHLASSVTDQVNTAKDRVSEMASSLPAFADHVKDHFDNLANNISLFSSSQGLTNRLAPPDESQSCEQMHNFFGAITREGPAAVGQLAQLKTTMSQKVGEFSTLVGTTLPAEIQNTKQVIINSIDAKLNTETDVNKIAELNSLRNTADTSFASSDGSTRSAFVDSLGSAIRGNALASIGSAAALMRGADTNVQNAASALATAGSAVNQVKTGMTTMMTSENEKMTGSMRQLEQLGAASSIKSLAKSDPCVSTLLGYVGTDSLLGKLK